MRVDGLLQNAQLDLHVSNPAGAAAKTGLIWFNSVAGEIRYSDGAQVLAININPPGLVAPYAGSSAPSGWLLCDGSNVSRTTYATLFGIIGTTYGSGDGSSTFGVPDLRGRAPIGAGTGSGLTARTAGTALGEETHTLTSNEMPSHTHTQNSHTHTFDAQDNSTGSGVGSPKSSDGTGSTVAHSTNASTAVNQNTGGGGAHNNMQPSLVMNFIIKT